jgi:phosphoribosylanthranilate isomerase
MEIMDIIAWIFGALLSVAIYFFKRNLDRNEADNKETKDKVNELATNLEVEKARNESLKELVSGVKVIAVAMQDGFRSLEKRFDTLPLTCIQNHTELKKEIIKEIE